MDRCEIVHDNFLRRVAARDFPAGKAPAGPLSPELAVQAFRAGCLTRALDRQSRAMQRAGQGFYTIGSSGHEALAAVALALRPTDMAFLHYRDAAFQIARAGQASFALDLLPGHAPARVRAAVAHPRGSRSLSSHLKSRLGLAGVKTALLHELLAPEQLHDADALARAIKALPVTLTAPRPVAEAISSAGGVRLQSLTEDLELRARPGVFCAGEMLDWEAPTGGYLLTASLASGVRAARGVLRHLGRPPAPR